MSLAVALTSMCSPTGMRPNCETMQEMGRERQERQDRAQETRRGTRDEKRGARNERRDRAQETGQTARDNKTGCERQDGREG